ncbi:MAG: hypothetical protein IT531_11385 [Burkholderiales bacterium]|nr:hypothetical protein [Burkholderiales bacterium]
MSALVTVFNPVGQCDSKENALAPRRGSLDGKSIGFIDNMKPNVQPFLQHIEAQMRAQYPGIRTQTVRKNFTSSKLIANELEGKVDYLVNAWGD